MVHLISHYEQNKLKMFLKAFLYFLSSVIGGHVHPSFVVWVGSISSKNG